MDTVDCQRCELVNLTSALACSRCGAPLDFSVSTESMAESQQPAIGDVSIGREAGYTREQAVHSTYDPYLDFGLHSSQTTRRVKKKAFAYWSIGLGSAGMPILWILFGLLVSWFNERQFGLIELMTAVFVILLLLLGGMGLGILALQLAVNEPKRYAGKRTAIPGIALSGIGLILFPVAASVAIPSFLASRRAVNEEAAMSKIKRIAAAEQIYIKSVGNGHCGDIEAMPGLTLLDLETAKTESDGYRFYIERLPEGGCEVHGVPRSTSEGDHSFYYSTTENQLRSGLRSGEPARKGDPLIGRPTRVAQN